MGIEERFVDPNTQEAPLPEYNKIVSPLNNPYHYIYDENYFEEWGDPSSEGQRGCLIAVKGDFESTSVDTYSKNLSPSSFWNGVSLLICGLWVPLGTGASKEIEDAIYKYMC